MGKRTIAQNVRELCEKRGLSLYAFERDSGIGNGTTARWAVSRPRLENLKKAADYFGVPLMDLLKGTEYET